MEPINLTDVQRLYLQAIFDYFLTEIKWPTHKYLERKFIHTHPDLDIEEVVQGLPDGLTNLVNVSDPNSKAILTVPGVYQCQGSEQVLESFVFIIGLCIRAYTNQDEPRISSDDLNRHYPLQDRLTRQVGFLLLGEPRIWSTFTGPDNDGGWSCVIAKDIRSFRGVKTIEHYLEKRDISRNVTSQPIIPEIVVPTIVPENDVQLHPDILSRCWDLYANQRYDDAILNATKALEVAVRTKANLPQSCVGIDVVNMAFSLKKPLLSYSKIDAEQEGMMSLLRGMIQVFKNPHSHRFVGVQDKSECLAVLLMCSNLLYVVDNSEFVG